MSPTTEKPTTKPFPKWMSFLPRSISPNSDYQKSLSQQRREGSGDFLRIPEQVEARFTPFPPLPIDRYASRSPVEEFKEGGGGEGRRGRPMTISIDDSPMREFSIAHTDRRRKRLVFTRAV